MSLINVEEPVAQPGNMSSTLAYLTRMFRIVGDVARAACAIPMVFSTDAACARNDLPPQRCVQIPVPQSFTI